MVPDVDGFYAAIDIELPRHGDNVTVSCFANPDAHRHQDRNKSCSVERRGKGVWNCHTCGASGGAYDAALARGRTPAEAMELLERYGLKDPDDSFTPSSNGHSKAHVDLSPVPEWQRVAREDPRALEGFTRRGITREAIVKTGVGVDLHYGNPRGGGPVVFVHREGYVHFEPNREKRGGKKKSWANGPRELWPDHKLIDPNQAVYIVEGEFTALAMWSLRLQAIGIPGVEGWKPEHGELFAGMRVVVMPDLDPQGRGLARRVVDDCLPQAAEVRVLDLDPKREDGDDAVDLLQGAVSESNGAVADLRQKIERMASEAPVVKPEDDWPELSPLEGNLPPFPTNALPMPVREWAEGTAEYTQTPVDVCAGMALAAASTVALGAAVEAGPDWEEPTALYIASFLPSGERKTACERMAIAPVRELEQEWIDRAWSDIRDARAKKAALESKRKKLVADAAKAKNPATYEQIAEIDDEIASVGNTVQPRLFADDATPEALAGLLADHGRLGIISSESPLLDNLAGRYSEGGANLHLVCKAYSGEQVRVDRRGRDSEYIEKPLLAIGLCVQPHVLQKMVENEVMRQQGLVARFALLLPASRIGRRNTEPPPVSQRVTARYRNAIRRVADTCDKSDKTPNQRSSVASVALSQGLKITLSPEAQEAFRAMRRAHEPRLAADLAPIADWANKHYGRVARIAGLLHLLAGESADAPISKRAMDMALTIGDYLIAHAKAALDPKHDPRPARLLNWLKNRGADHFTVRDAHRGAFNAHGPVESVNETCETLAELGYLRRREMPARKGGRPPSPTYDVNPAVHADERHDPLDPSDAQPIELEDPEDGELLSLGDDWEEDDRGDRELSRLEQKGVL